MIAGGRRHRSVWLAALNGCFAADVDTVSANLQGLIQTLPPGLNCVLLARRT
jgi:hypothetical protein